MCEHCGCLSLHTVAELTREHDHALHLIRDARWALSVSDAEAAARACAELHRLLSPHRVVEEEALFPAMSHEHPEHVAELAAEHAMVHGALAELGLAGSAAARGWESRLQHVLDVLRDHIRKEQDGLFPAALIALSAPDWEHAEAVRARVGSAIEAEPVL